MAKSKGKSAINSKTIVVNLFFATLIVLQWYTQNYVVDLELQGLVAAFANILLRMVTNTGIIAPMWFKRLRK